MGHKLSVGGQAVIEGVMMRGPGKIAVAVRKPNGEITVDLNPAGSISDRYSILKKPFLRGVGFPGGIPDLRHEGPVFFGPGLPERKRRKR